MYLLLALCIETQDDSQSASFLAMTWPSVAKSITYLAQGRTVATWGARRQARPEPGRDGKHA